jgi:hypothetical protein
MLLFRGSWIVLTSFRRERGLILLLPFLKLLIAHWANPDWLESRLVENSFGEWTEIILETAEPLQHLRC